MYVGVRSIYLKYDDFRRPVEGARRLSRACFSYSEHEFPLAWRNNVIGWNKIIDTFLLM
jgi:hypothetical protein